MSSLRELQQYAYRAIARDDGTTDARFNVVRLAVYRNNARETFHKTLAATYPVVRRLVGEQCFRGLARSYFHDFPSRSGDLACYGAELPTLLDIYYRDTAFAYLADVGRLEWACASAETATDGAPCELLQLARLSADDCAQLRFVLRAPVSLLSSRYPIFSIWEAHQRAEVEQIPLGIGAEHVIVTRRRGVHVHALTVGTYAFARSLADGDCLADAASAGETAEPEFKFDQALRLLAELDVLAGFRVAGETD